MISEEQKLIRLNSLSISIKIWRHPLVAFICRISESTNKLQHLNVTSAVKPYVVLECKITCLFDSNKH